MPLQVHVVRLFAILCGAIALHACSAGGSAMQANDPTAAGSVQTLSGGRAPGGGGGPVQNPPAQQIDGPAWSINNSSAVGGASPNVDYGNLQNMVQGAMGLGTTRSAELIVSNTSKKTALTISAITIGGPNAGDFSITPANLTAVIGVALPANKGFAAIVNVAFTPSAQGVRAAVLTLVSNAGTATVSLTGAGLPPNPVIVTSNAFSFIPTSAPADFTVSNGGSGALILGSIAFTGTNPGAFALATANRGFSNCFAGMELGPQSYCHLAVGIAPGAPVPASAALSISSNDPAQPVKAIQLTLTP